MATTTINGPVAPAHSPRAVKPASEPRVVTFQPHDARRYRVFIDQHADATLFHGLEWKMAVERAFGHRFRGLLALKGDEVVGALPLYEVKSVLAGKLLVSVPYATYGGILADSDFVSQQLFDAATSLCRDIGARSIELRSKGARIKSLSIRESHATFEKQLPLNVGEVDAMLPRKARAAARRAAERNDLTCEFGHGHLDDVWRLYARSMRRLASPNYPYCFFGALADALGNRAVAQIVRLGGQPVAGLLSFVHRDTFMPYFVGLDERVDVYGLSHYLYLQSMKYAVELGCDRYDFGRTRVDNAGPFEFKRLCGFEPRPLQYQTYIAAGRVAADLTPSSPKWSAARRIWKSLPLSVTRPLGGWLAKSIPG